MIPHGIRFSGYSFILLLAMLTGCLKSPSEPASPEPASITLSSYSLVLTSIGQRVLINATVLDQDSRVISDATIFFRSSNEKIATVSDNGLVTAVSIGTTQITVTSGYATASATVTVMQEAGSIEISPSSATLTMPGETVQLTAEVKDTGNTIIPGAAVVWSSSNPQYATVDANGLVTAVSIGTTRIMATSGGVSKSSTVYVETPKPAARIDLNISQATLTSVGHSLKLDALVYAIDGTAIPSASVAWSSSHPVVATVDTTGLVSAVANGTTLVTATSGAITTFATIHVVIEGTVPVTVRIEISPPSATLTETGETLQLTATVYDNNDEELVGAAVNWTSSDPSVATVGAGGFVTAVSNGTTRITAASGIASTFATIKVEIEEPSPPPEPLTDRDVLIAFYHATDGPNWTNNTNWLSNEPLEEWHGVTTDVDGRVTKLRLIENSLTGMIYPELDLLAELTELNLRINNLTGSIPAELGQLSNLTHLWLSDNKLTGGIPVELGNLSNLKEMHLNSNQLSGSIPPELGRLSELIVLLLFTNQLTGSIPVELSQLSNLNFLFLGANKLTGDLPLELVQLSNLTSLRVRDNQLSGRISPELGQMTSLVTLNIGGNQFTGSIPPELGQLENLESLNLRENQFTGSIPSELGQLEHLEALFLHHNQLTGGIPPELGQLKYLDVFLLHHNQLTGSIPPELGQMERVRLFELDYNMLTGGVPPELGDLTTMERLGLSNNPGLSGPLPISLTNVTLEELALDSTQLCVPADADFQAWLASIPRRSGIIECGPAIDPQSAVEREVLEVFYNATDGPNWSNNTNWLSDAPFEEWYGVTTDEDGRVTVLGLEENNLPINDLRQLSLPDCVM